MLLFAPAQSARPIVSYLPNLKVNSQIMIIGFETRRRLSPEALRFLGCTRWRRKRHPGPALALDSLEPEQFDMLPHTYATLPPHLSQRLHAAAELTRLATLLSSKEYLDLVQCLLDSITLGIYSPRIC